MAQKRFLNWKDAVKTFEIGEANLGKLQPGRYAGFDSIISAVGPTSGVLIDLIHTATGFDKTLENGSQTSNNAALVMPTGTIIHEDAPITSLDIESNLTNPDYRFDYIICEHEYVQSVGGTPATYSVIKGPLLAALPTIPNPDKQILIGVVRVDPLNDTDFSGLTYTKEPVPLLGNETLQEFRDKLELATKTYIDSADQTLQDNIDALQAALEAADIVLQNNIDTLPTVSNNTYYEHWSLATSATFNYLNDFAGGLSASFHSFGPYAYDVVVYVIGTISGNQGITMFQETVPGDGVHGDINDGWLPVSRAGLANGGLMIVPAGLKFVLKTDGGSPSSTTFIITIRKFGRS